MAKSEAIEVEAIVSQALPNAMFKLRLDGSDREILGIVSGKMRKHFIRILPGDRVKVQLSPYDLTKGRIVFRQKQGPRSREIRSTKSEARKKSEIPMTKRAVTGVFLCFGHSALGIRYSFGWVSSFALQQRFRHRPVTRYPDGT